MGVESGGNGQKIENYPEKYRNENSLLRNIRRFCSRTALVKTRVNEGLQRNDEPRERVLPRVRSKQRSVRFGKF